MLAKVRGEPRQARAGRAHGREAGPSTSENAWATALETEPGTTSDPTAGRPASRVACTRAWKGTGERAQGTVRTATDQSPPRRATQTTNGPQRPHPHLRALHPVPDQRPPWEGPRGSAHTSTDAGD